MSEIQRCGQNHTQTLRIFFSKNGERQSESTRIHAFPNTIILIKSIFPQYSLPTSFAYAGIADLINTILYNNVRGLPEERVGQLLYSGTLASMFLVF